jgi:pimeloyl-ACP methyl ester carboxylesterase
MSVRTVFLNAVTALVLVLDSPLPGIEPWDEVKADPSVWHFRFHQTPHLPERLLAGREFIYFREFFDRRAYPAAEQFNATERSAIDVPVVLAGGDHAMGMLLPRLAESLRQHGCAHVTVEVVTNSGHWVVDERPEIVADLIEPWLPIG